MRTLKAAVVALTLPALLLAAACSTNPATGKSQLNLYSEQQEVALGRQYHQQVEQQIGLYPDRGLQRYLDQLGKGLAARSERPNLPWTFAVVDDASINAFALPGGYIYATRGLMTHVGSEAELAGVLGHEIGHVTGRHQVNQMSKQQLTQLGLTLGMILSPEARQYGDIVNLAGGLLFLKFGRDDERQADDLGLRYLESSGYPPQAMGEVFGLLSRVSSSEGQGQGRLPSWLATHPDPEERRARMETHFASLPESADSPAWRREAYLQQLEDVVYGPDPRQGFFRRGVFYHPELRFRIEGPRGWKGNNQRQAVAWQAPGGDAIFVLTLAQDQDPRRAAQRFFNQQGVTPIGDLPRSTGATGAEFQAQTQQGAVQGAVGFLEHGGKTFQLLGFAQPGDWRRYGQDVARAMASFQRETDPDVLGAQPMRVDVVTVDRAMTLADFDRRYPSTVPLAKVALLNNVEPNTQLRAGLEVKRVVGGPRGGMD